MDNSVDKYVDYSRFDNFGSKRLFWGVKKAGNMAEDLDINTLWKDIIAAIEGSLNKPVFETLLSSAKPLSMLDSKLMVAVPNEIVRDWLATHCKDLNETIFPHGINKIEFIVGPKDLFQTPPIEAKTQPLPLAQTQQSKETYLNPRYTFELFVVGHSNRFAHAAALAVAETPAKAYNPLFIYGGVGLGKTHLMQAIGHHVLNVRPDIKVMYVTSETFTNDMINSIRYDKTSEFRDKYRGIDILLVDDIQFLAGKGRTQEEFFHTFNALYESSKQLVLSSDRPPKEIPNFEERLRSRFEWGLIADIQPPDLETRIAILRKKAEIAEVVVPDDVMTLIASKMSSNIRELEGALIRIVAYASLTGSEISIAMTDEVLKDLIYPSKEKPSVTIDLIKKVVAEYYSVKLDDMTAKIRTKEIATARQVAMYLARELTSSSLPKIGDEFGGRDHTTVLHAYEKIKSAIDSDREIDEAVRSSMANLKKYSP